MGRKSKGSWTPEEIYKAIWDWPNDTPMLEPISDKVRTALAQILPYDLLPYVLNEVISTDGFISKRLALNFMTWVLIDRETWKVDPDKILSLRRHRVQRFIERIGRVNQVLDENTMLDTVLIMSIVISNKYWHLSKTDFSRSTTYLAEKSMTPLFGVLDALNILTRNKYDVAAALGSVVIYALDTETPKGNQLKLL